MKVFDVLRLPDFSFMSINESSFPSHLEGEALGKASRTLMYSVRDLINMYGFKGFAFNKGADLVVDGTDPSNKLFINYSFVQDEDGTMIPQIKEMWLVHNGKRDDKVYFLNEIVLTFLKSLGGDQGGPSISTIVRHLQSTISIGRFGNMV